MVEVNKKMMYTEIVDNLRLISNDKLIRNVTLIISVFVIIFTIFFRPLSGLILYLSFISGFTVAWALIKYQQKTTKYLQCLINFYKGRISVSKVLKQSCSICDDLSCRRHQQSKSITPWKHIYITKELNNTVEHFYERIIDNFISTWYKNFSEDEDFLNELRYCFKFSTATIVNRLLELDIGEIIANKLIPCAIRHVDDYLYIQQIAKLKNIRFNEVVIEYLGKKLHAAVTNRKNELDYLRHMVQSLLPHVLPGNYLKCRNYSIMIREIFCGWVFLPMMDVIADPNILNQLIILLTTYKSKKNPIQSSEEIEFLQNYVKTEKKSSSFSTSLTKIKKDTELLYSFMQFLKSQDCINLLQFCLDVDEFNTKLLMPELSKNQVENLHSNALKLYDEYLDKNSFSFINCPSEISEDFKFLMQDVYAIEKLSKLSKLLYAAYDYVFNILETIWLPQFFHSSEFYSYICGSKQSTGCSKQSQTKSKRYESSNLSTVSKLSTGFGKIKGVLKTNQPIEGSFYQSEVQSVENGTADDIFLEECKNLFRDMSTWKVSIPTYQASPSNKVIYFYIAVERTDSLSGDVKKNWVVLRKDQDFYTLKAKLVEFHGESEISDSPLPSRKAGSSVETRLTKYEDFLRKLLKKSALKGSDLLYYFLTTEEDFQIYLATNVSNIQDIGNIYQSVAYKLRKEKGQHLDPFMTSFLLSTGRSKTDKLEWAEVGEETDKMSAFTENVPFPKTYRNQVFNDNFGVHYKVLKNTMSSTLNPEGLTESVFYILKNIFKIPYSFLKLYASICSIAQYFVDKCTKIYIERKIKSSLSQSNIAFLIGQLEDVVFNVHSHTNREEYERRKIKAFQELTNSVSNTAILLLGPGVRDGLKLFLEILQNPHFNKQMNSNFENMWSRKCECPEWWGFCGCPYSGESTDSEEEEEWLRDCCGCGCPHYGCGCCLKSNPTPPPPPPPPLPPPPPPAPRKREAASAPMGPAPKLKKQNNRLYLINTF